MTYARARLWLGISGVGLMVVLAFLSLLFSWPQRIFDSWPATFLGNSLAVACIIAAYTTLHVPLDYIGGYWLPCYFSRQCLLFNMWAAQYLRAALTQGVVFWVSAMIVLNAGQAAGRPGALFALALLMLFLIEAQDRLARFVAGLQSEVREGVHYFLGMDSGFAGGLAGLPGRERLVLPKLWSRLLPPTDVELIKVRRQQARGSRVRGLSLALLFNLSGFWACSYLPNAGVTTVSELFTTALGFTLWSFIGLLFLPTLSRHGVYEIDQALRQKGIPVDRFAATIRELDQLQDDEPTRPEGIEAIFHPVPSVDRRIEKYRAPHFEFGAWNSARYALYLSWPCLGFLSRAVHCNSGRPELWVMLPVD
jgi:hypothetical protein